MIVAGEESGDAHAASLVRALRERAPSTRFEFFGATGKGLRREGVEAVVRDEDLSILGLLEIARALPRFVSAYRSLKRAALARRPDAVVLVDWPDFNLALARALHKRGLKIIYYISPQLWAWRSHRVRQMRRDVDLLLTILPFEKDWYAERGYAKVEYVGHPLARKVRPRIDRAEFCTRHGLDDARPIVALLPGSRPKEFERHIPLMLDASALLAAERRNVQFVLVLASRRSPAEADAFIDAARRDGLPSSVTVKTVHGETREALAAADVAAVCSGTATLEAALTETPLVVVYRESFLNWHALGSLIDVEHYGLVNLVAGEKIAPELIQNEFTPRRLADELARLLDPSTNESVRRRLKEATARLGDGGASVRAAEAVLRAVNRWKSANAPG